jgi:hypoxanthine-DNA glycosylase
LSPVKTLDSTFKASFDPICNSQTRVLVLSTLPGDESLHRKEYYGNPRNRFWKVIARLAGKQEARDYKLKLSMLSEIEIGLWDVVRSSQRVGSLDSAIQHELVNDLDGLIQTYVEIKVIAFNGQKSAFLSDKYFKPNPKLHYVSLPSTSPANASWSLERLHLQWKALIGSD